MSHNRSQDFEVPNRNAYEMAGKAEAASFQTWVKAHERYSAAQRELLKLRAAEQDAWDEHAKLARHPVGLSWSDRFAEAFRTLWIDR